MGEHTTGPVCCFSGHLVEVPVNQSVLLKVSAFASVGRFLPALDLATCLAPKQNPLCLSGFSVILYLMALVSHK